MGDVGRRQYGMAQQVFDHRVAALDRAIGRGEDQADRCGVDDRAQPRLAVGPFGLRPRALDRIPSARRHCLDQRDVVGRPFAGGRAVDEQAGAEAAIADQRDRDERPGIARGERRPGDARVGCHVGDDQRPAGAVGRDGRLPEHVQGKDAVDRYRAVGIAGFDRHQHVVVVDRAIADAVRPDLAAQRAHRRDLDRLRVAKVAQRIA